MVLSELAIPLEQMTNEAKLRAEYATQAFAVQAGYTASIFSDEFRSYTWDNPVEATGVRSRGLVSAPPDNTAHTFDLTGRGSLPFWRTTVSGAFSYTMQRQDETFVNNVGASGVGVTPTNVDTSGNTSPNAKADLVLGNFRVSSRPLSNVTTTAFYRYFARQNDSDSHTFAETYPNNTNAGAESTVAERFTKQNGGLDIGWRALRPLALKAGYEYEHWNRGDYDGQSFGTSEHIGKAAADITPTDWFLGRVTYTYGNRNLYHYSGDPAAGNGPGFLKFNYADRVRNRVDALLQFSPWETFTPSLSFGYTSDNYNKSAYGLTDDNGFSAGLGLTWIPIDRVTFTGNYSYEYHKSTQNVFRSATTPWQSNSKDQFHIFDVAAILDLVPKRFSLTLDYGVTLGYSDIKGKPLATGSSVGDLPRVDNVLQIARIVGVYRLTDKLSVRGGFAYERYTERNFLQDPMQPFMGYYDSTTSGAGSVWLGATAPNYETYTFGSVVRYEF
jgi:MtrB/PioB family decaheme-associated outer membrane protein